MLDALRKLCAMNRHGMPMSRDAIAKATGYTPEAIRLIERRASRKFKSRLPAEVRAAFEELLAKDRVTATRKKTTSKN